MIAKWDAGFASWMVVSLMLRNWHSLTYTLARASSCSSAGTGNVNNMQVLTVMGLCHSIFRSVMKPFETVGGQVATGVRMLMKITAKMHASDVIQLKHA